MSPARRAAALLGMLLPVTLALALGAGGAARGATPGATRSGGLRLGEGELASETFALVARFDSGHRLFVEFVVTNLGFGDRNAAVIGHVIAPDGRVQPFRKAEHEGEWTLSGDGRRIALGSIVLDRGSPGRFGIDKRRVKIDLSLGPARTPVGWPPSNDAFGMELLQAAGPVEGTLWIDGMPEPARVRGRAALVHRWSDTLEGRRAARRVELFAPEADTAVYFVELAGDGPTRRWLVVEREGSPAFESEPGGPSGADARVRPQTFALEGAGLEGRIAVGAELVRFDPLADLRAPVRAIVRLVLQPETTWSDATFALDVRPGATGAPLRVAGAGFANVTFFEPPRTAAVREDASNEGRLACASAF